MTTCKRPECEAEEASWKGPAQREGYCSFYCDSLDAYRQDAQALYDALDEILLASGRSAHPRIQRFFSSLNHTYTEPEPTP